MRLVYDGQVEKQLASTCLHF